MIKHSLIALFLCVTLFSNAATIDSVLLKKHIAYLAGDKLKGRAPGTSGERKAYEYIASYFKTCELLPKGEDGFLQPFTYRQSHNPHDTLHSDGVSYTGHNVVGFLDNGKENTIVVGAHYDHLGVDGRGSSLEKKAKGKIHNGADDNASGTAGVLELANYFSSNGITEDVNFLFVCFSAEEAGLIGSKYYTNHPTISLDKVQCMINMDMIGRLVDSTQKLLIYGVGTSDVFVSKLNQLNQNKFQLVLDSAGIGPSDQTSFYLKHIPVLHFFTGQHSDYHKSSDDIEKINFTGEVKVLEFIKELILDLAKLPKMKFYETQSKESAKSSFKVTFGIMPDYGFQGKGLRIDAVNKDKPAEKAGLKSGDVVVGINDLNITNIYDYMGALGKFQKGQTVKVSVVRNNKPLSVNLTF
ncbi:MAG: M20/M25/M40 family metallo-hydrolase [Bacteroidetes bacterium]|nr:M20/M25/M40 family metallo-hydrolase [Bacteroidota bacterium]